MIPSVSQRLVYLIFERAPSIRPPVKRRGRVLEPDMLLARAVGVGGAA
jgi:hypothetical protein